MEEQRKEEMEQRDRKLVDYSPTKSCRPLLLFLADNAVCGLIIGPLTVLYWRGTWSLFDVYLFPNDEAISAWICFLLGNVGLLCLVYLQKPLGRWIRLDHPLHWILGCHLYTYVLGGLNVCQWRGLWYLLDHYTGVSVVNSWITFAIGQSFRCIQSCRTKLVQ